MDDGKSVEGEELARFLGLRDVACTGCGYNLPALSGDARPGCNTALLLRAGVSRSH